MSISPTAAFRTVRTIQRSVLDRCAVNGRWFSADEEDWGRPNSWIWIPTNDDWVDVQSSPVRNGVSSTPLLASPLKVDEARPASKPRSKG